MHTKGVQVSIKIRHDDDCASPFDDLPCDGCTGASNGRQSLARRVQGAVVDLPLVTLTDDKGHFHVVYRASDVHAALRAALGHDAPVAAAEGTAAAGASDTDDDPWAA